MNTTQHQTVLPPDRSAAASRAAAPRNAASSSPASSAPPAAPPEMAPTSSLSDDEQAFLALREEVIDAGRHTFLTVGMALLEIREYRDGLLYAGQFGTFERYCKERWDFGRSYAYRLTDAAAIFRELSPMGDTGLSPMGDIGFNHTVAHPSSPLDVRQTGAVTQDSALNTQLLSPLSPMGDKHGVAVLPTNERQLRPLKKLADPKLRRQAWERARQLSGPRPTAGRDVQRAVRLLLVENGANPLRDRKAKPSPGIFYKISAADVAEIRKSLASLRHTIRTEARGVFFGSVFERIDALLPPSAA